MATRAEALQHLRQAMAIPTLEFRDGQWEAIDHIVNQRGKVLCVQRTGWGKSMRILCIGEADAGEGAGATVIISPLLALMRNQIEAAQRLGFRARTVELNQPAGLGPSSG
jgi:ATP-dependent DNA helicase RecQ